MNFFNSFLLNVNGLFDFDLTFPTQALLFLILAIIVTNVFLSPISKQLDERALFIDYTLKKSIILLNFGYEKLSECVHLITEEIDEMNRQIKLTRNYTNSNFEKQVFIVENENLKVLSKLKGDLSIKSAYFLSTLTNDLNLLTDNFFKKKFQSNSF
jgi:hypothetical protein